MTHGKGLGRGLEALFGEENTELVHGIRITDIEPNPNQPRRDFDEEALAALTESIRQNGVITPITVRKDGDYYKIIAGERRWRASRAAGLTEIPAIVLDVTDEHAYELALIENLQREDLNPIEEAEGYKTLIERLGLTQAEAAEKVGISRPAVANSIRLLALPEELKKLVSDGKLSGGHARTLLGVTDKAKMLKAAQTVIDRDMSVRDTENLVRLLQLQPRKARKADENAIYINDLQRKMSTVTGHKITIDHRGKKGRLTIEYYGNDDLERICDILKTIK